ncbi:MAG: hypothetical protein VKS61_17525 [Candidatus Sericytochromatia bacterium]|nr:hypothetical protein [Candidatus Sericytochromatia bacterium]
MRPANSGSYNIAGGAARPRQTLRAAALGAIWVAGCAAPGGFAGVEPAPTPTPEATPIPGRTGPRLQGTVKLQGRVMPGVQLRAFDLASGAGVPLTFRAQAAPASYALLQAIPTTTAVGGFNFALPAVAPERVLKLVATQGDRTWIGLWLSPPDPPPQGATLRLTATSTVLARCVEGVLKLGFRLGPARRGQASRRTLARLEALTPGLETSFTRAPNSEPLALLSGNVPGTEELALHKALRDIGADAALASETTALMQAVAADLAADTPDAGGLFPLQGIDFPIGRFTQASDGTFTWEGPGGAVVTGKAGRPDSPLVPLLPSPPSTKLVMP